MTDHARPTRTAENDPRIPLDSVLVLSGDNPLTVLVRIASGTPQFSSDGTTWFNDMSWQCGDEYALFITFQLLTAGIELGPSTTLPTLRFSPVLTDPNHHRSQLGSVPPVTATTPFSFNVGTATGPRDPQIVVTPINGDPDGGRVGRA